MKSLKSILILVGVLMVINAIGLTVVKCHSDNEEEQMRLDSLRADSIMFANKKEASVYLDSLITTKDTTWRDSLVKFYPKGEELKKAEAFIAEEKERMIKAHKANVWKLRPEYDKVEQITWYTNSLFTHDNNSNHVSLYIARKESLVALRIKASYYGDDWIFFDSAKFAYGGETAMLTYKYSEYERDNRGGYVWEWVDTNINDTKTLRDIAESDDALIRFSGKYTHDHTLTSKEKKAMLEVLDGYESLCYLLRHGLGI